MPTEDEIKIILNVINADKVEQARKAIEQEEEAIRKLGAALDAGTISRAQFDAAAAKSAQTIQAQTAAIKAAGGSFNSRALVETSRIIDDIQYGISGCLNNLPGLIESFGGSAGLAGAVGIVGVAFYQAWKHFDDLQNLLGNGKTLSEAAAMEELAKVARKTAEEFERLARYQGVQGVSQAVQTGKTEAEQKQESDVTKAITEAGATDVARGMLKANPAAFDSALPGITKPGDEKGNILQNEQGVNRTALVDAQDAQRRLDDYRSGASRIVPAGPNSDKLVTEEISPERLQALQVERDQARKALDEARRQAAIEQAGAAALSKYFPNGLQQLRDMVETNPDAFGPKGRQLSKDLADAGKSPEDIEEEKAQAHLDAQEAMFRSKMAEWENKAQEAEDEADREGERARVKENADYEQRNANAQYATQKQRQDEDEADRNTDAMTQWRKDRDRRNQSPQVFTGFDSIRDAIQQSIKRPDRDPTAVEIRDVSREIAQNTKRTMEFIQNLKQGPARFG